MMHVLITNILYVTALGRQAIFESVSGSFAVSFHSPLCRLPSFSLSISEVVCVGLGVDFGPCTAPPPGLKNSGIIIFLSPNFYTAPFPLGVVPHPLDKRGAKERERIVQKQEIYIPSKTIRKKGRDIR